MKSVLLVLAIVVELVVWPIVWGSDLGCV